LFHFIGEDVFDHGSLLLRGRFHAPGLDSPDVREPERVLVRQHVEHAATLRRAVRQVVPAKVSTALSHSLQTFTSRKKSSLLSIACQGSLWNPSHPLVVTPGDVGAGPRHVRLHRAGRHATLRFTGQSQT